jgi:MFS transporter, DHA1 family, inner membrane transport protein
MAFLRNDAINRVNLHSGIQALAQGAGGLFFFVFLVRAGVSPPAALLVLAATVLARFLLRPLVLPLAIRWGVKPLLIAGTLLVAVQYPVLAEVDGIGLALFAVVAVAAVGEILYFVSYHAYFAILGDTHHRGHQLGAREALVAVVSIVAPLLGAWGLVTAGPRWTFAAVGLVQALAVVPLLGIPNVAVKPSAPGAYKAARPAAFLIAIDGWFDVGFFFVWQIALYIALGESIPGYGGAMALAGLVGAACGLVLGRHVDLGGGRRVVVIACLAIGLIVTLRAVSLGSPWLAIFANAIGALAMPLLIPVLGTATYNLAKTAPCPFRFQLATEGGWDIGCLVGCVVAAGLLAADAPMAIPILLALPATAAFAVILWRYFPVPQANSPAKRAEESSHA